MNVRNDLQAAQILGRDIQFSSAAKMARSSDAVSLPIAGDEAHLSGAASLASHLASLPDVREEKVQAIQTAIANGSYSVSSSDVARSLMDSMLGGRD